MIHVESLTKNYGNVTAIDSIGFQIDKGEIVGFLGPNGAGKTTTMRILTCFMPATSGKATVAGYDVFKQSLDVRRHIGYLPENVPLYVEMTVTAYLRYVTKIKGVPRSQRASRIDHVLQACGLPHMRHRVIGHLSKGYRQRVGLAQALVHDPDVLIMDEPTSGLDPRQRVEIRELIRELGREHTVILSTHILPEASQTCERILVINEGQMVGDLRLEDGQVQTGAAPDDVMDTLRVEVRNVGEGLADRLREIAEVATVREHSGIQEGERTFEIRHVPGVDIRPDVARVVVAEDADLLELRQVSQSLEEVFLRLTSGELLQEAEEEVAA